ncbi:hypothetical protein KJ865_10450, partial [Myxococcota bacterium]|nr:hypothetical protein [Myxococcota bacterium]
SIISQKTRAEYDPLKDATVRRVSGREVAVLEIVEVTDTTAVVNLGLGDDVHPGDLVYYTTKGVKSARHAARRWGGMQRLQIDLQPGFILGDGALMGSVAWHYHAEEPLHVAIGGRPWLFSGMQAMDFSLRAGFETSSFEAGIGVGGVFASYSHAQYDQQLSDGRAFFEMYVRLGALDGLSWELGMRSSPSRDNAFTGFWTSLQMRGTTHLISLNYDMMVLQFAGPDDPFGDYSKTDLYLLSASLRDRIRLWGNGGPGTLYLPVFVGIVACTGDVENKISFIMGGGVEIRW